MAETIQGTFHFHSTYSHDGRNSLAEIAFSLKNSGYSFCVMTEHFEDFDEAKFIRYIEEANQISRESGFIFIPGIEVHLAGVDTIMFPVQEYEPIRLLADEGRDGATPLFKVVAHPSKYPFEKIVRHLETFQIDAIELWNQQADSSYIPPLPFLELVDATEWRDRYKYFFGCDLHSANLTVANVIVVDRLSADSGDAIVQSLKEGNFTSRNLVTGIEFRNVPAEQTAGPGADFRSWLKEIRARSYYRGKMLRKLRRSLRAAYKKLPRDTQHWLNDVKNFVRNKI
jgi:hypothetical protein